MRFEPLDTLFFRDGQPYNQGELSQTGVVGTFPPAPPTLVGAVRAACARFLGWKHGNWNEEVRNQLGDGRDLGPLRFRGPVIVRETDGGSELLFPAPAHLMGKTIRNQTADKKQPACESLSLLSPAQSPGTPCDLGQDTLLPVAVGAAEGARLLRERGWWLTAHGLGTVLQNKPPDPTCLVHQDHLWKREPRVGIARSQATRTIEEGAMYSPVHVRLSKGVTLAMEAHGLPEECMNPLPAGPHPVGGESRACWLRLEEEVLRLPNRIGLKPSGGTLRYTVIVLTPADTGTHPRPGDERYAGLPGRVVSACLPRPVVIGGWDSVARKPLPLRPHLAPGSVVFLEARAEHLDSIKKLHGTTIGNRAAWGFGLIVLGRWHHQQDRITEQSS